MVKHNHLNFEFLKNLQGSKKGDKSLHTSHPYKLKTIQIQIHRLVFTAGIRIMEMINHLKGQGVC